MDKESLVILIGIIALVILIWNFVISIRIMKYLNRHGEKINHATMHFKIFENASKYKQLTLNETGKVGNLYTPFIISFVLFAVVLLSGIIMVA